MVRHNLQRGVTVKRPRSFLGGIERLEARTLLAGAELIGAGESDSKPRMPLHDPLQIAAPAYVRQLSIVSPQPNQPLQNAQDGSNGPTQPDTSASEINTDFLKHDQAFEEWDQESPLPTETEDSETSENEPPAVSPDELDGTGVTVTDETSYTSPKNVPTPVLANPSSDRAKSDTSATAMITLVSPPQSSRPLVSNPLTVSSLNAPVTYADGFHYFETSTSRTETPTASLTSEPLANHAARDTFMAMSMLKPSGIDNRVRASATIATSPRSSDSNPTIVASTTRVAQEQVSHHNTDDVTQPHAVTHVRLGSLPVVTLLHSVMFAGQMVLNSTAEVIELNQPSDTSSDEQQSAVADDAVIPIAMTQFNQGKPTPEVASRPSWRPTMFIAVVCASLHVQYSLGKRNDPLHWTWISVQTEQTD